MADGVRRFDDDAAAQLINKLNQKTGLAFEKIFNEFRSLENKLGSQTAKISVFGPLMLSAVVGRRRSGPFDVSSIVTSTSSSSTMALVNTFCFMFSIRFGSFFAACYVLIAAMLFLMKDITWIYVLTRGHVPAGLNTFVLSIFEREKTNSTKVHSYVSLATINITEKHLDLTKRYIASYVLHAAWSFGGLTSSIFLMIAVINQHAVFVLPWMSWSAVNVVIVLVNCVVDLVMWIHFKIHSSLNWFALFSYISLPFLMYQILIVASYFSTIESTAAEPMSCDCCRSFSVWSRDHTESYNEFSSPAHLLGGNETVPADHAATCESVQEDAYNERILERKPIKIQRNPSSRFHKPKIKITQPSFDCDAIPDC